jgi:hypothetical protein
MIAVSVIDAIPTQRLGAFVLLLVLEWLMEYLELS